MRILVATILLAFSTSAGAAGVWFEPVTPTSHSFVKVQIRGVAPDACVPRLTQVARQGNVIDVSVRIPPGCNGISVPTPWQASVAIGVLEPGVYEVKVSADYELPRRETLVIADAAPPFHVTSSTVRVTGGETITLWREADDCTTQSGVTIGGVAVPVVSSDCMSVTVVAPPHAAGAVDVSARFGEAMLTTRAALRYVDPAAAPDESAFERVLIPLLYDGPGAYGSQWVTEGRIYPTETDQPLRWMHDVVKAECASASCEGNIVELMRFGNHPAGLLLFLPRDLGHVETDLFVRDTSRENASWGAQVPVVREPDFVRERTMRFPDIPFVAPYRALLRIYGVDAASSHVRVFAGDRSRSLTLSGTCGFDVTPCNSARPAFAAIDLLETFPELAGRGRFSVAVVPIGAAAQRHWAFVSITNNETQHVTVVTP
ncbi:MAG TPA: hypothetical protein VF432_32110 [Thermoanaerobaculia bacterium]